MYHLSMIEQRKKKKHLVSEVLFHSRLVQWVFTRKRNTSLRLHVYACQKINHVIPCVGQDAGGRF